MFKDDIKDFIEAGKLFLNVDLGSGIIRSNGKGVEFEIEQGFTCRKYVGSSSKDKEIVCISTKDFDIKGDLQNNVEEHFDNNKSEVHTKAVIVNKVKVEQEQLTENKVENPLSDFKEHLVNTIVDISEPEVHKIADLVNGRKFDQGKLNEKEIINSSSNSDENSENANVEILKTELV